MKPEIRYVPLALGLAALATLGACSDETPTDAKPADPAPVVIDMSDPVEPADAPGPSELQGDSGLFAEPVGELPEEFRFVERSGKEMTFGALRGRYVLVDFVFTSCSGPCPPMMSAMSRSQERLSAIPDLVLVSITVDPQRDTPDVLADYAQMYEADPERWLFARMPIEFVNSITHDEFQVGDGGNPLAHSMKFFLIDTKGRCRGAYEPLRDKGWTAKVVADVARLRAQSPE